MLGFKFLILELGVLMVYAGVKGLSLSSLVKGDNQTTKPNVSISGP